VCLAHLGVQNAIFILDIVFLLCVVCRYGESAREKFGAVTQQMGAYSQNLLQIQRDAYSCQNKKVTDKCK
jgi:hypothetical protein